jgi:mRNA (guanine-N7-)-methyltransferase
MVHCLDRYNALPRPTFGLTALAGDCFAWSLEERLPAGMFAFDVASIQFVLHYSFGTEARARMMMRNLAGGLTEGGVVVATIPDANRILKHCRSKRSATIGNSCYCIEFAPEWHARILDEATPLPPFGVEYTFYLEGAVDKVPEYLVHVGVLASLAEEHGLELVEAQNFHEFYYSRIATPAGNELASRIGVFDAPVPEEQWEASGMYMAVVFRKRVSGAPQKERVPPPLPAHVPKENIILLPGTTLPAHSEQGQGSGNGNANGGDD